MRSAVSIQDANVSKSHFFVIYYVQQVSSMLSEVSDNNPMVYPDYEMSAWHHTQALILVNNIGSGLPDSTFKKIFKLINQTHVVTPVTNSAESDGAPDKEPVQSRFRVRYVDHYYVENNEWGEFQKHRQVLGLVSVGGFSSLQELEELKRLHQLNLAKYQSTVLDTRLLAVNLDQKELDDFQAGETHHILSYNEKDLEATMNEDFVDFCTAIFWILESKRIEELQKEGKQEKVGFLSAPFEKKDFVGLDLDSRVNKKRTFGRYRKNLGDLCLLCDKVSEAYKHYEVAVEILKSCNDWIWLASALEGICAVSTIAQFPDPETGSLELFDHLSEGMEVLPPKDIVEKYKEIVVHYSKYRQAGMIETEASVKAVHVLTQIKNYLTAAEFLQNLVFINLNMNDLQKIERFAALSKLYSKIGFHRKAAFFLRVAAMRCVAPQNPKPDWPLCYNLLMEANFGYSQESRGGWPALKIQLIQELVGTARKMGNIDAAVIHITHLFEVMFENLSSKELDDICKQLTGLVAQQTSPDIKPIVHVGLTSGKRHELTYTGMNKIPEVSSFHLSPLPAYLTPKTSRKSDTTGVFMFTPKSFGGGVNKDQNKVPFSWVQDDVAEVQLVLLNPLPMEIKIVNLVLLTEGVKFEAFPSTFSLTATKEKIPVSLLGIPKEPGRLRVVGYSCTVLGLPSSCLFEKMPSLSGNGFVVDVIPSLPLLQGLLLPEESSESDSELQEVYVLHGERVRCQLLLTNVSNSAVQIKDISWSSTPPLDPKMCLLSNASNSNQIDEKQTLNVGVCFTGSPGRVPSEGSKSSSLDNRKTHIRNRSSDFDQFNSINLNDKVCSFPENIYELELKVSYSSSKSKGDHYRELVKKVKLYVSPSAFVTKWDVLPSETLNKNYIVLDIENQTESELEITYDPAKSLAIEPGDECRIPLPVSCFEIKGIEMESRRDVCRQFLRENVVISWQVLGDTPIRKGRILLDNLHLTEEMVANLELLPTDWTVLVDDEPIGESDVTATAGKPVKLTLKLSSGFRVPLNAQFHVDVSIHGGDFPLDEVFVQTQKQSRPLTCQPNGSVAFNSILLPLVPGKFEVECSCNLLCQGTEHLSKYPTFSVGVK